MYLKPIRVPKLGTASSRLDLATGNLSSECQVYRLIFSYTRSTLINRVATRLRAHGVHEYDIQDLLGHSNQE